MSDSHRYRVQVPEHASGYDADARLINRLLNDAEQLFWEIEGRNHSAATRKVYRLIDSLKELATDELHLDVIDLSLES